MLNLNRASLSVDPINTTINAALERAAKTAAELPRPYLGASIVGSECLRRVQYDWWCSPVLSARTREIFDRVALSEQLYEFLTIPAYEYLS